MWFSQRIILIVSITLILTQVQSAPIDNDPSVVDDIFDIFYDFFESLLNYEVENDCDDDINKNMTNQINCHNCSVHIHQQENPPLRPTQPASTEQPTTQSSTSSNTAATPVPVDDKTIAPTTAFVQTAATSEAAATTEASKVDPIENTPPSANAVPETTPTSTVETAPTAAAGE